MLSDSSERRPARAQQSMGYPPPQQTDPMPCPRCDSISTKFCYYNNYNLSQPRHFCKSCRRYWTQGGTLRDVPVGGGSRKNSKRSRSCTSSATSASTATSSCSMTMEPVLTKPISVLPNSVKQDSIPSEDVNLNENGGLTSLLNSQGPGFLALGGYGMGLGSGFDDQFGFGYGRGVFQFPEVGDFTNGGNALGSSSGCNTWQINGGEGGLADGDCFAWPDLTISMSGKGIK